MSISDDEGLGGLDGGLDAGGGIVMGDTGEIPEENNASVSDNVSDNVSPRTARTIASEAESVSQSARHGGLSPRYDEDDDFEFD